MSWLGPLVCLDFPRMPEEPDFVRMPTSPSERLDDDTNFDVIDTSTQVIDVDRVSETETPLSLMERLLQGSFLVRAEGMTYDEVMQASQPR